MNRKLAALAVASVLIASVIRAEEGKKPEAVVTVLAQPATFSPASCFTIASPFSDVTSLDARCPYVRELYNDGIAGTCAAGRFCPDNPVTKGQLAVYLERVMRGASSWDAWTDGPISPSGLNWGSITNASGSGTMMEYTSELNINEASGIYFDGDTAILWSPGDGGLLRIFDQDGGTGGERFRFSNSTLSFINGSINGPQKIGFYSTGIDAKTFGWNDTSLKFELTGAGLDLIGNGGLAVLRDPVADGTLSIDSMDSVRIGLDEDNTTTTAAFHIFHHDTAANATSTLLRLEETTGDLKIRGALSQNFVFDLAESFLATERLEPGDVVASDPHRANAVRRARREDGAAVLGIVSTRPGVVLGGAVMDRDTLTAWGPDVRARFEKEWPRLRAELLSSPDGQRRSAAMAQSAATGDAKERAERSREFENDLESQALEVFAQRNFVPVALAGRVPVKVDAGLGSIATGDPITISPFAGIAMRASSPGLILGTALEPLTEGRRSILVFVSRGWWGGTTSTRAAGESRRAENEAAEAMPEASGPPTRETEPAAGDGWTLRARGGGQAEMLAVSEPVAEGDVLVMDANDAYRPSAFAEDATVVGVVGSRPALLAGRRIAENGAAVVVTGITTVKVDATWGAIERGDLLVSSPTRGHAMRADDPPPGTILGKALESFAGGTGTIRVLVMLR
jgi:hypothetical protein